MLGGLEESRVDVGLHQLVDLLLVVTGNPRVTDEDHVTGTGSPEQGRKHSVMVPVHYLLRP